MRSILGKVIDISHEDTKIGELRYRVVRRKHVNGYSISKMVWTYSDKRKKVCWCGLFTIESGNPINLGEASNEN